MNGILVLAMGLVLAGPEVELSLSTILEGGRTPHLLPGSGWLHLILARWRAVLLRGWTDIPPSPPLGPIKRWCLRDLPRDPFTSILSAPPAGGVVEGDLPGEGGVPGVLGRITGRPTAETLSGVSTVGEPGTVLLSARNRAGVGGRK